MTKDRLLSAVEAAQVMGVSVYTLKRWVKKGYIRYSLTPGRYYRFKPEDLTSKQVFIHINPNEGKPRKARK